MLRWLAALCFCLGSLAARADMMPDIVNANPAAGCTAATNYLARTSGGNEAGNAANITTLICGLVTDGVITGNLSGARGCGTKLDVLYITAQQIQADALLNLCGTSYSLIITGTPTFTSLRGFGPFTVGNYLDTGFNSTTATAPNFTQNSASFGNWLVTLAASSSAATIGSNSAGSTGESHLYEEFTDNSFYARVTSSSTPGVVSPGTPGYYVGDRTSSATVVPYYNGGALASQASTSQTPFNGDFFISNVNGSSSIRTVAAAHIGGTLGALNTALYTRLRTYMTAVGVP